MAVSRQHRAQEGNLGRRPGAQLLCSIPGRYSVVECCRWVATGTLAANPVNTQRGAVNTLTVAGWP